MNFKDISLEVAYRNVGEDRYSEIISSLLCCAKTYKRSVGFFSSSALNFIGEGILTMARNGGKIHLATSPKLNEEDIKAIRTGYELRDIVRNRFISEVQTALSEIEDENARVLAMLIKEKILDIKIVLKDGGMYHDKLAVLEDYDNNSVIFVGSPNETGNGYSEEGNYEVVRVFQSWNEPEKRLNFEKEEFEQIWSNSNEFLQVFNFMEAFNNEVIERVKHEGIYKNVNPKPKYKMREYQIEARNNWISNGNKGFFIMATGTGKTITSLYTIKDFVTNKKVFTVIAVPYKHLVNQWYDDVKHFFKDAYVQLVHGEVKDAESKIFANYELAKRDYKPMIVITTIKSFFIDKFTRLYDKINFDKLLIVDEAHNFINNISNELSDKYKYKLGLSATPVFGSDADKSKLLVNWFGGVVQDFPIEKAIGKYLVNYEYHPIFVNATENDEEAFNKATKLMISAIDSKRNIIVDETRFTLGYRGRLRAISMAEEKISSIKEIFSKLNVQEHTIIYCSDGKVLSSKYKNGKIVSDEVEEMRHLEHINSLINNAIITNDRVKSSKFTATEDVDTRMRLIDEFNKGGINYLVAIRCLDEGINIPSIKTALILSSNDNYREFVQRRGRILRLFEDNGVKKEKADIYDVIVLPSLENKSFAEIEFRRFQEYAKLALNKDELDVILDEELNLYGLTRDDIQFKNEFIVGGELDD